MSEKKPPAPPPAGMVKCAVQRRLGPHKPGTTIYMHPMDALEHHTRGIVEADKAFVDDLKVLEAEKRKQKQKQKED